MRREEGLEIARAHLRRNTHDGGHHARGVIFRMVLLPVSATKTLPAPSTAMPWGSLKRAAAPVPSALPDEPAVPASVVTTPARRDLPDGVVAVSATKTLPAPSTATP